MDEKRRQDRCEGLREQLAFWIARLLCIRAYMSTVTIPGGSDEAGHKRHSDCGLERGEPHLQEALISHGTETRPGAILFDHLVEKSGIRGFLRHGMEQGPIPARCQQAAGGRPLMPLCEIPDSFGRIWQAWDTYPQGACIQSATIYSNKK